MNSLKCISIIIILFFSSCQKEEDIVVDEIDSNLEIQASKSLISTPVFTMPKFHYSKTELVVLFDPSVTAAKKANLRNDMGVSSYETCAHCDGTIEKWTFDLSQDTVTIEHKYEVAKDEEAEAEGLFKVDREFKFTPGNNIPSLNGATVEYSFSSKIVPINSGVTIAVLDTGVDPHYSIFMNSFLYKNETDGIESGWDYVNGDANCYDDNLYVHGTIVTSIINNYLIDHSVPHQVLPVKIAGESGAISLYEACCGMSFAAGTVEVNMIQLSFGWYDPEDDPDAFVNDIFSSLIERYDDVLFVCSAGNSNSDNDDLAHYPSNYDQPNIIAVAAVNAVIDDMADYSNYGALSVDFISKGTALDFPNLEGVMVSVSGTSFSAPQVTAMAAKELFMSAMPLSPSGIIGNLYSIGIPVDYEKPTMLNRILVP